MDNLIHIANVLLLLSFLASDMFWLRTLQVVASISFIGYFSVNGLYSPIAWNVVFMGLNLYHGVRIYLYRRPIALTPDKADLYHRAFQSMSPRDFLSVINLGTWRSEPPGTELVTQGEILEHFMLIAEGRVSVRINDEEVARLGPGSLIGEMSYIAEQPTSASVWTLTETRLVDWVGGELKKYLDANPELRSTMHMIIGSDLVGKLRAAKDELNLSLVRSTTGNLRGGALVPRGDGEPD
ncbi:MAG: hypothetical protein Tsb0020_15080 [Haliangiales bacterium]